MVLTHWVILGTDIVPGSSAQFLGLSQQRPDRQQLACALFIVAENICIHICIAGLEEFVVVDVTTVIGPAQSQAGFGVGQAGHGGDDVTAKVRPVTIYGIC